MAYVPGSDSQVVVPFYGSTQTTSTRLYAGGELQGSHMTSLSGLWWTHSSYPTVQFTSVAQSCPTLCDPMNRSTPGLPVHHQFLEFTQTHVHRVSDAIQPSHPLLSPSRLAPNPSQHQYTQVPYPWIQPITHQKFSGEKKKSQKVPKGKT